MTTDTLGIYVHIPFCKRKCHYCDFCSLAGEGVDRQKSYVDALLCEIKETGAHAVGRTVDTVYIGGGTPSLLDAGEITRITETIKATYVVADRAEVTLEANPGTLNEEKLRTYLSCGINRLSLGMQSGNADELRTLGRIHTREDVVRAVRMARAAGFDNISLDIMYGIPGQTLDSLTATLDFALSLGVGHISTYSLKIEEGTPFYRMRDSLALPSEDEDCDMYEQICSYLAARGYRHYEISNFARAGWESRHNTRYWRCSEYIGVGASAHSYFLGKRYENTSSVSDYIDGKRCVSEESIDGGAQREEFIMLGLRLGEGIGDGDFSRRFGASFYEAYKDKLEHLIRAGLMRRDGERTCLTDRGMYVSNAIIVELLS